MSEEDAQFHQDEEEADRQYFENSKENQSFQYKNYRYDASSYSNIYKKSKKY